TAMTLALAALAVSWGGHASPSYWGVILAGWLVLGIAYSASITPGGRLLRRSSGAEDRPALFAAQFALSHVCWLVAYPLAGQTGALGGMG
ncbi:MFS transporter, partial [Acinetobacter baumannii]